MPSHQTVLTAPGKSLFHRLQYSLSAHADSKRHARAVKALELRCCAQAAGHLGEEVLSPSLYSKTLSCSRVYTTLPSLLTSCKALCLPRPSGCELHPRPWKGALPPKQPFL